MPKKRISIALTLFLLLSNLVVAQTNLLHKKVTLSLKNTPIETVIKELSTRSGVNFSYSSRHIKADRKINFTVKNVTLKTALEKLSTQTKINFKVIKNQVVLTMKKSVKNTNETTEKYTISGYLKDALTGENLIGATVFVPKTGQGAITNEFGFYSLTLPKGNYTLAFSYIGYQKTIEVIRLAASQHIDKKLSNDIQNLPPITIKLDFSHQIMEKSRWTSNSLRPEEMKNIPEFGGETGLIKSLQTLPGIKSHSDGSAYFFVRGGQKDQNLILLDDAPLYNPAHLFGFYSVFIPDFIKDIKIYKADMPINQGDRLSSVIDIRTKDGNLNNLEINGIINPLVSSVAVEGPIIKEKTSFFLALRHSNFKWLYKTRSPDLNLYFADLNAKVNFKINNKNRLFLTFYSGKDELTVSQRGIKWTNNTATFRWNHLFSDRLFTNTVIYGSSYRYNYNIGEITWKSDIANLSLKSDFTFYKNPETTMKFGFNQTYHAFNPGNIRADGLLGVPKIQSSESVFYYQTEKSFRDKWSVKAGVRLPIWSDYGPTKVFKFDQDYRVVDTIDITDKSAFKTFVHLDPRVSIRYHLDSTSSLNLSTGIYHQYMQLLSNSNRPFTSLDVWIPAGANIKPQKAEQIALNYTKYLPKNGMRLEAALYYKKMYNQIDYKPHANMLLNPLIEGELRFGEAKSYGLELFLKKNTGKLTGWVNYTLSKTLQQTPDVNDGKEYPAFYDRPHDFAIFLNYKLSKRTNFSANWMYYTGSAISTPIGFYDFNGTTVPLYGEKNADRLPDYHRLDLAFKVRLNKKPRKYSHSLTLSVYNAYFQKNPISLNFNKIKTKSGKYVVPSDVFGDNELLITETDLIRVMPSLTYKFSFVAGRRITAKGVPFE